MGKKKLEQTKGYAFLIGEIYGIDNKEPMKTDYKNTLKVRIKTNKNNSVFAIVGGWNNSTMSCKLKAQGMDVAEEIPVGEVADVLQDYFHDGDSVLVRGSIDVNTYKDGRLDINISGIYATSEPVNFDSEDFEERNELTIPMIISEKFDGKELGVKFVNYKGEDISQRVRVEYEPIKKYLNNRGVGDLIPSTLSLMNVPIFEEIATGSDEKVRTTVMGKRIGSSKLKRKIVGSDNYLLLIDVDSEKAKLGEYDIENSNEDTELPF
jgi:hypothetical protein